MLEYTHPSIPTKGLIIEGAVNLVGKEREHVELPLSPLPLFLDVVAKNQLSENTADGHRSIREKWDVKVAIFFTLKNDLLDQRRFDLYERGIWKLKIDENL